RLAYPEPFCDRSSCHPEIDTITGHSGVPLLLGEIVRSQIARKSEITPNRLADALSVKSSRQRVDNARCNGSIIFVTVIKRCNEVKSLLEDWLNQELDPVRCDALQVCIDESTGPDSQVLGDFK